MQSSEYIFTAIIIFTILVSSATMISLMPRSSINVSEIEQLKMVAQKIMTQLILNPGNPPEWGSNITVSPNNLTAFGLAKYGEITRGAFLLDLDKVQRLNRDMPQCLYIPPNKVIELFNLANYGLKLEFIPALNVNVTVRKASHAIGIFISVISDQMLPIADVNVAARVFYLYNGQIYKSSLEYGITNIEGSCKLEFNDITSDNALIILVADYHGICAVKTYALNCISAYFVGDYLILNSSLNIINNQAYQIIIANSGGTYIIDYVIRNLTQTDALISDPSYSSYRINDIEPSEVALLAVTEDLDLLAACKSVPSSYSSISGEVSSPLAYTLERVVMIGDSTYTLKLHVWRMSW